MSDNDLAQPVNTTQALSIDAPGAGQSAGEDKLVGEEDLAQQWKNAIHNGDLGVDFGICTFIAMHWKARTSLPGGRCGGLFVMVTGLLVLFAQITLPIMYTEFQYEELDHGICMGTGRWTKKLTMFAVAGLYAGRLSMRSVYLLVDATSKNKFPGVADYSNFRWSTLNMWFNLDVCWTILWEGFVYMMNLVGVFLADNIANMVLGCLSVEFMLLLDNGFVDKALKVFSIDGHTYALNSRSQNGCVGHCVNSGCVFLSRVFSVVWPLCAIIFMVVAPLCKN